MSQIGWLKCVTRILAVVVLVGSAAGIAAAQSNSAPVVTNITLSQRTDGSGLVDIRFDLADADGNACDIMVEASSDGGSTWTVPTNALTGHVGPGVMPGAGKQLVWNLLADLPAPGGLQLNVRVCAEDGQGVGMILIPAGEFLMGDQSTPFDGYAFERPAHAVYVDAFYMDRYEVTNQLYADALNWAWSQGNLITVTNGVVYKYNSGTSYPYCDTTTSSLYSRITWNGSAFGVIGGKENHPMAMVSWWGSAAYANWRSGMAGRTPSYDTIIWDCNFAANGYRLPTEAEWEKAARGGASGHRFPWSDSDTVQHARANYYSSSGDSYDTSPTRGYHPAFSGDGWPYTSPAGYFAPNGYGLYDMAGNVWEWGNDWWGDSYYTNSPYSNPHGPVSGGGYRVIRGGSWGYFANFLRCALRANGDLSYRYNLIGFRLALDAE